MNPKNQEEAQEAVLQDPVFEPEPEDESGESVAECESLPMPTSLHIIRTDSSGSSFSEMNGTPVGYMQLQQNDGTFHYLPQYPTVSVPLCSLTSLERLSSMSRDSSPARSLHSLASNEEMYDSGRSRASSVCEEPTDSLTMLSPEPRGSLTMMSPESAGSSTLLTPPMITTSYGSV